MNPLAKKTIHSGETILVTDSGLGGMSVFAQLANYLRKKSPWQNVSMVYFNAWPEQDRGYNHFENMNQKATVFNNAMNAMKNFQPDMILIACNTLSVIYPFTSYSQNAMTKVSGIVDSGVQLIHQHLMSNPDSRVIIFGTPTTVAEKTHQKQLVKMGIEPDRITNQGCADLAGKIERNPFDSGVSEMIDANVSEAVSKMCQCMGKVYAALCCTHFGYCSNLFSKALSQYAKGDSAILNPNQKMVDQVMESHDKTAAFTPEIDMQIVSRVFWEPARINAYTKLLKDISPETVKALSCYEWKSDLFKTTNGHE